MTANEIASHRREKRMEQNMSKPIRRNLANFFVLALLSISVVPTLIETEEWAALNYVTAAALAVGVVWFMVDLARTATASSR